MYVDSVEMDPWIEMDRYTYAFSTVLVTELLDEIRDAIGAEDDYELPEKREQKRMYETTPEWTEQELELMEKRAEIIKKIRRLCDRGQSHIDAVIMYRRGGRVARVLCDRSESPSPRRPPKTEEPGTQMAPIEIE